MSMDFGRHTPIRGRKSYLARQQEISSGTIIPQRLPDGNFVFEVAGFPGRNFESLAEARTFMQQIGLTTAQDVVAGMPGISTGHLELMREKLDDSYSVVRQTYKFDSEEQLKGFRQARYRGQDVFGMMHPDENQATLVRLFKDGRELQEAEVENLWEATTGTRYAVQDSASKVIKRAKSGTSVKRAKATIKNPFIVSIVDETFGSPDMGGIPQHLVDEALGKAYDGITEVSDHGIDLFLDANRQARDEIIRQMDSADALQKIKLQRSLKQIESAIEDFTKFKTADYGSIANTRMENFDILLPENIDRNSPLGRLVANLTDPDSPAYISLKGNIVRSRRLNTDNASKAFEDRIAARTHHANIKLEFEDVIDPASGRAVIDPKTGKPLRRKIAAGGRIGPTVEDRMLRAVNENTFVTAELHHITPLRADAQAVASYPELFGKRFVKEQGTKTLAGLKRDLALLDKPGGMPNTVKELLEGMQKYTLGDEGNFIIDNNLLSTREAEEILDMLGRNHRISSNPHLHKKMIRVLTEGATKKELLRLQVPAGFRAEVIPRIYASDQKLAGRLKKGMLALDESGGIIMHEMDAFLYHMNYGGFDFDDQLASMLRRDRDGKYKLLTYRNPLSRGEWGHFDILPGNERVMIDRLVELSPDAKLKKEYEDLKKDIHDGKGMKKHYGDGRPLNEAHKAMKDFERKLIPEMPDISDIPMREPVPDQRVRMGLDPDGNQISGYRYKGEKGIHYYADVEEMARAQGVAGKSPKSFSTFLEQFAADEGLDPRNPATERAARYAFAEERYGQVLRDVKSGKQLGRYVNARTMYDNFMAHHYEALSGVIDADADLLRIFDMEDVVDALTGSSRVLKKKDINKAIQDMTDKVVELTIRARVAGNTDVGFSEALMENRNMRSSMEQAFRKIAPNVSGAEVMNLELESLLRSNAFDHWEALRLGNLKTISDNALENVKISDNILNFEVTNQLRAARDADDIVRSYRNVLRSTDIRDFSELSGSAEESIRAGRPVDELTRYIDDEVMRAMLGTFEETKDDMGRPIRVAGQRTMEAFAELARRVSTEEHEYGYIFKNALSSRVLGAMDYGEDLDLNELDVHRMADRVIGSTDETQRIFRDLLSDVELQRLNLVQYQLEHGPRGGQRVSRNLHQFLEGQTGPRVLPVGDTLPGLLDPRTYVLGVDDEPMRLGDLMYQYLRGVTSDADPEDIAKSAMKRDEAAEHLMRITENYLEMGEAIAQDPAMNMDEGMRAAFGQTGARRAEHAAKVADDITNPQYKRISEFMGDPSAALTRRIAGYSALALIGATAVNMFRKRDRDVTPEHFQGPEYMPGGNPYTQSRPSPQLTPRTYNPQPQGGTTYEVRADSGGNNTGFLNALAGVTGGAVLSTIFEDSFTPDLESILGDY